MRSGRKCSTDETFGADPRRVTAYGKFQWMREVDSVTRILTFGGLERNIRMSLTSFLFLACCARIILRKVDGIVGPNLGPLEGFHSLDYNRLLYCGLWVEKCVRLYTVSLDGREATAIELKSAFEYWWHVRSSNVATTTTKILSTWKLSSALSTRRVRNLYVFREWSNNSYGINKRETRKTYL